MTLLRLSRTSLGLFIVVLGVTMSAIDSTIVVLALPAIMRDIKASLVEMMWVILIYILIVTVIATQVGRLGDKYGRSRIYNMGFVVFTLGSALCGLSPNGGMLVAFRAIQGLGGALIGSNSGAVIADMLPPNQRGKAYGYTSVGWNLGAILGVLLGGIIVTFVSWRYIFFINVPIGIFASAAGFKILKDFSPRRERALDVTGSSLLGSGLALALLGLTFGAGYGLRGLPLDLLIAGIILLIVFSAYELRAKDPIIRPDLFKNRVFTGSILASLFQALGNFAVLFLIMMYLQGVRGLSPFEASVLVLPGYVSGAIIAPFVGRLADKYGARIPATAGLLIQATGIFIYTRLSLNTPLWTVTLASLLTGSGSGAFYPANNSAVMANAPREHYGVASGMLRTFANIGMVVSFALSLFVASISMPPSLAEEIFLGTATISGIVAEAFTLGLRSSFALSVALMLLGALFSLLRGKEVRGQFST